MSFLWRQSCDVFLLITDGGHKSRFPQFVHFSLFVPFNFLLYKILFLFLVPNQKHNFQPHHTNTDAYSEIVTH